MGVGIVPVVHFDEPIHHPALAEQAPRFAGYGLAVAEALLAETPALLMCPGPFCPAD